MGKFIVSDNQEVFSRSTCMCEFCTETHKAVDKWDTYTPQTNLQYNMLDVAKRIEERYKRKISKSKSKIQKNI